MDNSEHDGAETSKNQEPSCLTVPAALKCDNSDSSSDAPVLSSTPKVFLRPSSLAAQTEKLKILNTVESGKLTTDETNDSTKVGTEASNSITSDKQEIAKIDLNSTRISTSFSDPIPLKCSQSSTESSFNLFSANSKESHTETASFVFGQNLHERAANYDPDKVEEASPAVASKDLTFESLQKEEEEEEQGRKENERRATLKRTLSDAAKEYESKKVKTILEEVSVVTGEEEEYNVLQINCKLFSFEKEKKNWHEKGRGILRLNDKESDGTIHSRVVVRTQGSLRVILNTKIWSGMTVEHASEKTIRLTALDSDGIKVFLVMSSAKDSKQLFSALECRISALKSREESSNKNCSVNDSPVDESASLSSAFDISSNDSFQDYSRKCFGNIQTEVEPTDCPENNIPSKETKDSSFESDVTKN